MYETRVSALKGINHTGTVRKCNIAYINIQLRVQCFVWCVVGGEGFAGCTAVAQTDICAGFQAFAVGIDKATALWACDDADISDERAAFISRMRGSRLSTKYMPKYVSS
jgi:hypothetical protein